MIKKKGDSQLEDLGVSVLLSELRALRILIGEYDAESVPVNFNLWPYVGQLVEDLSVRIRDSLPPEVID